jgi:hypothetical protein
MASLQNTVRKHLFTILLLLLAGGFATLLAELLITDHVGGIQSVAVIASGLGLALVVIGLFARSGLRFVLVVLLLILSLSGLVGAFEHFEEGGEAWQPQHIATADYTVVNIANRVNSVYQQEEDDDEEGVGEPGGDEGSPPLLAPLSLNGLALMAAVTLLAKPDQG